MTRSDLVDRCKAIIQEAYEEATEMIAAYIELNPSEQLQTLCKEIDPENWNALRQRVQRAQDARKASPEAMSARSRALSDSRVRHARSALRDPEIRERVLSDFTPTERAAVVRAAVPPAERSPLPRTGPTFIELIVRVNSALIELEGMVAGWPNLSSVPREFSRDSFSDIVAKALRIQDRFDALAHAIEDEDEDEFLKIVRNFKVVDDVR